MKDLGTTFKDKILNEFDFFERVPVLGVFQVIDNMFYKHKKTLVNQNEMTYEVNTFYHGSSLTVLFYCIFMELLK